MKHTTAPRSVFGPLVAPLVAVACLAGAAAADDSGYGVMSPSGSVFTTEISPAGDLDTYIFRGYPGMVLTAKVKPTKGSTLAPDVHVLRPGGVLATDEDGLRVTTQGASVSVSLPLDAVGYWTLSVGGAELSTGGYSVSLRYGAPVLRTLPFVTKSFSRVAAIDSKTDTDDYTFEGYPGQSLSATLKLAKGSTLIPGVTLQRPDGTALPDAVTTVGTKVLVKTTMDQQGTWRIHVIGREPTPDPDPNVNNSTTGGYSISVKLGRVTSAPSLQPDANDQYKFTIPATGGAKISYSLLFTGDAPVFNSFVDPTGYSVPGFPTTTSVRNALLGADAPFGNYTLTFDAPAVPPTRVSFAAKVLLPKSEKARKAALSKNEPVIQKDSLYPTAGGRDTLVRVGTTEKLLDSPNDDPALVKLYLGHTLLNEITYDVPSNRVTGKVPDLPRGMYDVVLESTGGQVAVRVGVFEVVASPIATTIDPSVGSSAGQYPITITGSGFRPGHMGIILDGDLVPVAIDADLSTETSITFTAPSRPSGFVQFGVVDRETQLAGNLPLNSFEYVATPAISRVVPNLTTVLGGDTIYVRGANFSAADHVFLETAPGSDVYEEMNAPLDAKGESHVFTSPPRNKGVCNVYVTDQFGQPSPHKLRTLTFFQFTNITSLPGVLPSGSDPLDGYTTAIADYDKDGADDLFLARRGSGAAAATPQTRVLRNSGSSPGHFTDVTQGASGVMPAASSSDDWRADRLWVIDVTLDGYPDIVIVTNDTTVPEESKSHLRILVNEVRGGVGAGSNDRVFRDRTLDLMPTPRVSGPLYGGTSSIVDNWRGLDMWVGDIDHGGPLPPEILITHKEVKEELDVGCGAYCASPYSSGYTYGFYWGGSRCFTWNKAAKAGQGAYKFEHNFFPRKSGVRVQIFNPPAGVTIPICNSAYGKPCRGKFTPFTGKRIAVGHLDTDGKPDVAILSDDVVMRDAVEIPSLQVGINKVNSAEGSLITDVTNLLTPLGGSFRADTVEIGQPGFPDGNPLGVIAISSFSPISSGNVMRLIKFKTPVIVGAVADFEEITASCLPLAGTNEKLQASKILFRDVDTDGDQDMILVCKSPPGGTEPGLRILRNEVVNTTSGIYRESLRNLVLLQTSAGDLLEGDFLSIGDVNKDGAFDYVVTRNSTTSSPPQTRILITDKTKTP